MVSLEFNLPINKIIDKSEIKQPCLVQFFCNNGPETYKIYYNKLAFTKWIDIMSDMLISPIF